MSAFKAVAGMRRGGLRHAVRQRERYINCSKTFDATIHYEK
jgi:hypothetical protein